MPRWVPEKIWNDQDCIILGGGNSLRTFDWSLLKSENTIGCNTAFVHGPDVCKICIFGDLRWWKEYQFELSKYSDKGGVVFTNCVQLFASRLPWLWTLTRENRGLHTNALGWNGNTGASAINLAILLGAKRVYLLGFDMQHVDGRSNWHNKILDPNAVRPFVYPQFCTQFKWVVKDWKEKFSNVEIYNVTESSGLSQDLIPWLSPKTFWAERVKNG